MAWIEDVLMKVREDRLRTVKQVIPATVPAWAKLDGDGDQPSEYLPVIAWALVEQPDGAQNIEPVAYISVDGVQLVGDLEVVFEKPVTQAAE